MFEDGREKQETDQQQLAAEWEEKIQAGLEDLYQAHSTNQERVDVIKEKINFIVKAVLDEDSTIIAELDDCLDITDKDAFIKTVMKILQPLIDAKMNDPEAYEAAQRNAWIESSNFTKINDLISYEVDNGIMRIHVAPNETTSAARKLTMLREGLAGLAKVVQEDKSIKTISGTSWIVAQHPQLLEKLGFTVEGAINDAEREQFFAGEEREVHKATISRQELLNRYL